MTRAPLQGLGGSLGVIPEDRLRRGRRALGGQAQVLVGEAGGETAAGGALEGVDGIVILEHGRSYAYAFRNAPRTAGEAASSGILNAITGIPKK